MKEERAQKMEQNRRIIRKISTKYRDREEQSMQKKNEDTAGEVGLEENNEGDTEG